jgi:glycosyltransferase involved in cell wall biosynthesis
VVAEYYPRRRDPALGVWAHRQAVASRDAGADVRVLVLERPVPPVAEARAAAGGRPAALRRSLRALAAQPRHDAIDGIPIEYVRFVAPPRESSYSTWYRWARRPLRRALERLDAAWPIDVVHAHYALPAGAAALGFCQDREKPLVVSVHGGDVLGPALAGPDARARVRGVLRRARLVLANSSWTLARCAELTGSSERMRVVHLGARAPDHPPPRRHDPTVATLAHVVPRKRHGDVLRALRLVRADVPGLRYVVVGDGPHRPALERLAGELGVADRVEWTGHLAPAEALDVLSSCHLMALPSVDEAFGVAYVEAMACGLPAIGCRGEGGPEEIADLGGGLLLVPPADVEALTAAIRDALVPEAAHRELSEAARRTAREHFTWEACGRATVAAYADALEA